ncbi:MAG: alpha/beta hydrolase [Ancalomicrobiaceae bacterium]|nr:alpha/beta hydrolase [Ancalomicrobiaceae bacterium]
MWVVIAVIAGVGALTAACALYTAIETQRIEARYPPVGRYARVGGLTLHYVEIPAEDADAPAVLFVHGASGNLRDPMLAFASRFSGRYRLLFVDRPGHGYSTRGAEPMSAPAAQAEVIYRLAAQLGVGRAIVVGHSWGAAVAAAYAVQHPAAVAGLMLITPATHPWPGGVEWYYRLVRKPVIGPLFLRTFVVPVGEWMMAASVTSVFAPAAVPPGYIERAGIALVLRPDEFAANAEDVVDLKDNVTAFAPRYAEITSPTVIVSGESDTVVLPSVHAEALARQIRGARIIRIDDTGHMPQFTHAAVVAAAIEDLAERSRLHQLAAR